MIVFARGEQVCVHVLNWIFVFDRMILEGNHMNYIKFVTSLLSKSNGDDVWCASAMIRLNFHSDGVCGVVLDCSLGCVCSLVSDRNDHGIVRGVPPVVCFHVFPSAV